MTTPSLPGDAYWVIDDHLLAGPYPGAPTHEEAKAKLEAFLEAGVTTFIDLTEEEEGPPLHPYSALLRRVAAKRKLQVTHLRLPIRDVSVPTSWQMHVTLAAIRQAIAAGERVYVHCWGGVGRTGTVVGCLAVESGVPPQFVFDHLAEMRRGTARAHRASPETTEQLTFVESWQPDALVLDQEAIDALALSPSDDVGPTEIPSVPALEAQISTAALAAADVPAADGSLDMQPDSEYPPIWRFAKSYGLPHTMPYDIPGIVAEFVLDGFERHGAIPGVQLDTKRLALWSLSELFRGSHDDPRGWDRAHPRRAALARALVADIRRVLFEEEAWWWEPDHEPTDEERWRRALTRTHESADIAQLYLLAVTILSTAIERRDRGCDRPLDVPLTEADPIVGYRLVAAHQLARGLASTAATLEDARDKSYREAAATHP